MARVTLARELVVRAAGLLRQAERSIDAAHHGDWKPIRQWYCSDGRRAVLERVVVDLRAAAPPAADLAALRAATYRRCGVLRALVRLPLRLLQARRNRTASRVTIRQEWAWFASMILSEVLLALGDEHPEHERLVELRMDCYAGHWLIECDCPGLPEWKRLQQIECYLPPPRLRHYTLDEVLAAT